MVKAKKYTKHWNISIDNKSYVKAHIASKFTDFVFYVRKGH